MMRDTPRTFVGTVVLLLQGPVAPRTAEAVRAELGSVPGVSRSHLDPATGTLAVTAETPVDRTDVVAVLDRLGCAVRV